MLINQPDINLKEIKPHLALLHINYQLLHLTYEIYSIKF